MPDFVKIKTKATGVESIIPVSLWHTVKKSKQWGGVFKVVVYISEPPEVKELRKRLKNL